MSRWGLRCDSSLCDGNRASAGLQGSSDGAAAASPAQPPWVTRDTRRRKHPFGLLGAADSRASAASAFQVPGPGGSVPPGPWWPGPVPPHSEEPAGRCQPPAAATRRTARSAEPGVASLRAGRRHSLLELRVSLPASRPGRHFCSLCLVLLHGLRGESRCQRRLPFPGVWTRGRRPQASPGAQALWP